MPAAYLTPAQLVERWSNTVSVRTLANWRYLGRGPRFVRIGGRIAYKLEDVVEWEQQRAVNSTAEYSGDGFI